MLSFSVRNYDISVQATDSLSISVKSVDVDIKMTANCNGQSNIIVDQTLSIPLHHNWNLKTSQSQVKFIIGKILTYQSKPTLFFCYQSISFRNRKEEYSAGERMTQTQNPSMLNCHMI